MVDAIAIIPFDLMFEFGGINKIARVSRITKIYKLIRMSKMMRLLKLIKVKSKLMKSFGELLKIGAGTERLFYLLITFFVSQHVISCIW